MFTVVGLKAFHTMVSQMFVAMKREIPDPRPYPFWSSSSKSRTIRPATNSCLKKFENSVSLVKLYTEGVQLVRNTSNSKMVPFSSIKQIPTTPPKNDMREKCSIMALLPNMRVA